MENPNTSFNNPSLGPDQCDMVPPSHIIPRGGYSSSSYQYLNNELSQNTYYSNEVVNSPHNGSIIISRLIGENGELIRLQNQTIPRPAPGSCPRLSFDAVIKSSPASTSIASEILKFYINLKNKIVNFVYSTDTNIILIYLVPIIFITFLLVKLLFFDKKRLNSEKYYSNQFYTILTIFAAFLGFGFLISCFGVILDSNYNMSLTSIIENKHTKHIVFSVAMCLMIYYDYLYQKHHDLPDPIFTSKILSRKNIFWFFIFIYFVIGWYTCFIPFPISFISPIETPFIQFAVLLFYTSLILFNIALASNKAKQSKSNYSNTLAFNKK